MSGTGTGTGTRVERKLKTLLADSLQRDQESSVGAAEQWTDASTFSHKAGSEPVTTGGVMLTELIHLPS